MIQQLRMVLLASLLMFGLAHCGQNQESAQETATPIDEQPAAPAATPEPSTAPEPTTATEAESTEGEAMTGEESSVEAQGEMDDAAGDMDTEADSSGENAEEDRATDDKPTE